MNNNALSMPRHQFQAFPGGKRMSTSAVTKPELAAIIMDILNTHKKNPDLLVPLTLTTHAHVALDTLIFMASILPEDNLVLKYLLKAFSTPIKVVASIEGNRLTTTAKIPMTNSYSPPSVFKLYPIAGVYVFTCNSTGDQYVGSAINFISRVTLHLQQLSNKATPAYFHNWVNKNTVLSDMTWSPVYYTQNFFKDFIAQHPGYRLSLGEFQILQAYSQFLPRVLEANILNSLKPSLNRGSGDQVYFNHVFLNPGDLKDYDTPLSGASAKLVEVRNAMTGELIRVCSSIVSTATFLELSRQALKQALGSLQGIKSKSLNILVTVNKVGQSLLNVPIARRLPNTWSPLILVNTTLDKLEGSDIYIYTEDLSTVYAKYSSWSKAYYGMYPSKSDVSPGTATNRSKPMMRACNYNKAVKTELGTFYVARNPKFHTMKDC